MPNNIWLQHSQLRCILNLDARASEHDMQDSFEEQETLLRVLVSIAIDHSRLYQDAFLTQAVRFLGIMLLDLDEHAEHGESIGHSEHLKATLWLPCRSFLRNKLQSLLLVVEGRCLVRLSAWTHLSLPTYTSLKG